MNATIHTNKSVDAGRAWAALNTWKLASKGELQAWNELRKACIAFRNQFQVEFDCESYDELLRAGRTKDALALAECRHQDLSNSIRAATSRKWRKRHQVEQVGWAARMNTLRAIVED